MQNKIGKLALLALILVYLVIVAGAVVRMTGSGMGCPDWPKCFGYYIPPTDVETLQWAPNKAFDKGQVIIVDETLQIAVKDFSTSAEYKPTNWEPYTKHDYAVFNVWHTWIEYINRLLGAQAGLATLALAIGSIWYWSKNKKITILAWLVVFGMAFQAWLGATVVYSVLEPLKITLHMLMALLIVAMLLFLIHNLSKTNMAANAPKSSIHYLIILSLILTFIQIILGTQVRQFVDEQIDQIGYAKNLWLQDPTIHFYIHRSLSIAVLALNGYLFWSIAKMKLPLRKINWVGLLILMEIATGIAMYYLDFPFASQPLHLVLASILFGVQFYLVLEALHLNNSNKSL
ncbi:MAG: COX15/CtaA family protein [Croceitalea sp.]|nr:COX15/CtaA family protein [Croceitalea sp.]